MNSRKTTVMALLIVLLAAFLPLMITGGTDGATADDVSITIDGGSDSINLDMSSDGTTTATIFVKNESTDFLSLSVKDIDNGDVTTSSTIMVNNSEGSMLYPRTDSLGDGRNIAIVTVTLQAQRLADTGTVTETLELNFTTIGSKETFTETVPITIDIKSVYTSEGSFNKFFGLFPNTLPEPLNSPWFTAAATLVLWILATIIVCELIIPIIARIVGKNRSKESRKKVTHTLTKSISVMMFVIALNECFSILGANAEIMSSVKSLSTVLYVIIGSVIVWQVYVFMIGILLKGIDDTEVVDGIDTSLVPLFKLVGKVVICVMAATVILAVYGVDLAGIMVSAGVITLGITFGAQQIISQFFSGIVILATRPFKKGDFVNLNGTTYIVRKVRLMYTEFNNWDKDQVITMPNNAVSAATMVNYTKDSPATRIFIYMDVAYDTDLTKAKELMIKAAKMHPHVISDGTLPLPGTRLTNFLDSGIEYRLACFVDDYDNSSHYAGQIREIIYKLFLDNDIEIPYNRLQIDILSECDGKKRPGDDTPVD